MKQIAFPDKHAVRRAFERSAATYDASAVIHREVGQRLLEHLDPIRIEPSLVVDAGCGTGGTLEALSRRFPQATLAGVDLAHPMLLHARPRTPLWRRAVGYKVPHLVCGDAERLPIATGAAGLVFSNLALQWCHPGAFFAEAARVLPPGGLFIFSTFGPDTLRELRSAFTAAGAGQHVNAFADMHDLGDALVQAGFADPVMEMEVVTLEYRTVESLARDLKAVGATALPARQRGLTGKALWKRMAERYESFRRDGALPATYEVVYGHAWKVAPKRTADGRQVIEFHPTP
ncbi:MAG TPA: malonyl-ACP O-methyltransferase BioC [Usitatibacter sp.]